MGRSDPLHPREGIALMLRIIPLALVASCCCSSALAQEMQWQFDDTDPGALPSGFTAATGSWAVAKDETATSGSHVLAQSAESRSSAFNVLVIESQAIAECDLTVRLRAIAGREDQGGGLIWRARDAQNYYLARYNPLEDNFRVYRVEAGRRHLLGSATVALDHAAWHTMGITMRGDHIECSLDGSKSLDAHDSTFGGEGRIGLWTKADARTQFDDLSIRGHPSRRSLDADAIGRWVGAAAQTSPDGVVRVTWPRDDVAVRVDGMPFAPPAGLTSWAAFSPMGERAMVMGDTVLFQDEVDAAIDAAFAHGLTITALHNHFFFDEPKVYFMHIGGRGGTEALATGVRALWEAVRSVRSAAPTPATRFSGAIPTPGPLDAEKIGAVLGGEARVNSGVVKVSFGRSAMMGGGEFGGSMGLSTWAAFSGSDAHAAVDGDFAMIASEVDPVLRALRLADIHVVALHNHMIGESPAYFFVHYWGTGPAAELARRVRTVLDTQRGGD